MSNVRSLAFCNYVVWKDIQWFWSANFNALFSRNLVSGEVKRWGKDIKHNKKGNGTAYSNVVLYHDKIIAIPGRERKILIFDLETESFRYIDLKMGFTKEDQNVFFAYAVSDKRLFMIGNEIPYILDFDMESEKILGIVNLGVHIKGRQAYFRDAVLDKDKLIVPLLDENLVFEIDTDTLQWTESKVGDSGDGFSAVCKSTDSIWLMPRQKGAVLQWNRENGRITAREIEKEGFRYLPGKNNFHSGHFVGKRIWIFPFQGNMVLSLDAETGELVKENAINRYIKALPPGKCVFRAVQAEREHIFLLCLCKDEWVHMIYDPGTDKLDSSGLKCEMPYEEYLNYLYKAGISTIREKDFPLESFVGYIAACDIEPKDRFALAEHRFDRADCINGCQIWNVVSRS